MHALHRRTHFTYEQLDHDAQVQAAVADLESQSALILAAAAKEAEY